MPLPTFLLLIAGVIIAAGLSIAVVQLSGISMLWLALAAPLVALGARGLTWL